MEGQHLGGVWEGVKSLISETRQDLKHVETSAY